MLPYVIGFLDGVASLVFDGLTGCAGGFGAECYDQGKATNPARYARFPGSNTGYLSFVPSNITSASAVMDELSLILTGGRLDRHARTVMLDEDNRAVNMSSCPLDRSTEFRGRLTPGDKLHIGERVENADGEVLCMTYDGVAKAY